jgi:hypothetical protein
MQVMGGALGYVLVAFVIALVNALLVSVVSGVCVRIPRALRLIGAGGSARRFIPQTLACFPLNIIPASRPRAPPALFAS